MNSKLLTILFVVSILLILASGLVSADRQDSLDECTCVNSQTGLYDENLCDWHEHGGIWCKDGKDYFCALANDESYFDRDCVIDTEQRVRMSADGNHIPLQKKYYLKSLTLEQPLRFSQENTNFANSGTSGGTCSNYGTGGTSENAGNGGEGGEGGCAGDTSEKGRAGGGGGAGGELYQIGGLGGQGGGNSKQFTGNIPFAGANIALVIQEKLIFHTEDAEIINAGDDGRNGPHGSSESNGGGQGGRGGEGGAGAGTLYISATTIEGDIKINLTGGNGGNGGNGGEGYTDANQDWKKTRDGGSAGGAGAGLGGNLYLSILNDYGICDELGVLLASGNPGQHGTKGESAYNGENGERAQEEEGSCGTISEISEDVEFSIACFDGIDNDGDNYVDMQDSDCYNEASENGLDIEGPIFFNPNVLGMTEVDGISWWDPFATDGSDGICGDDGFLANQLLYLCEDVETEELCNVLEGCESVEETSFTCMDYATEYAEGLIPCEWYDIGGNKCTEAPDWCETKNFGCFSKEDAPTSCSEIESETNCINDYGCQKENIVENVCKSESEAEAQGTLNLYQGSYCGVNCEDLGETSCFHETSCVWQSNECIPKYNSIGMQDVRAPCQGQLQQNCEGQGNGNVCVWREYENMQYDRGFVDESTRYYCADDYYYSSSLKQITSLNSEGSSWTWWDAYDQENAFKIHEFNGVEFISNARNWSYCDVSDNIQDHDAIPIQKDSTFPSASTEEGFPCTVILNTLVSFFTENCTVGTMLGGDVEWLGVFENHYENIQNKYVCTVDNNGIAMDELDDLVSEFTSGCLDVCGKAKTQSQNNEYVVLNDLETTLSYVFDEKNYLKYCDGSFEDYYCDLFPCGDDGITANYEGDENLGYLDVDACGYNMEACLGGANTDGAQACNDIEYGEQGTDIQRKGYLCETEVGPSEYGYSCLSGEYAYPLDIFPENPGDRAKTCCVGKTALGENVCNPLTDEGLDKLSCEAQGGQYLDNLEDPENYICTPEGVAQTAGDHCCLGIWKPKFDDTSFGSITQNTSFICYDQSNNGLLAECCTDFTVCNNADTNPEDGLLKSLFYTDNSYLNGYYRKGGVLHTLRNFEDNGPQNDGFVNYFARITPIIFGNSKDIQLEVYPKNNENIRSRMNWNDFDNIEFDIAYNNIGIAEETNVLRLHFENNNEDSCYIEVVPYLTNGKEELRWHHAVLPYTEAQNCTGFDFTHIDEIYFTVNSNIANGVKIGVDNIYLSENPDEFGNKENSDNYYCTGNFATWIDNLDGPNGPEGFLGEDVTFEQYGPYAYACEAQASYDWTGRRCCGDQTKQGDYWNTNTGEYFEDKLSGCFHGTTVYPNVRVGDALNDIRLNNLLFYDGHFLACGNDLINDEAKYVSYNAMEEEEETLVSQEVVNPFEIRGNFICDPTGRWVNKESYSVSRIIASRMYEMAKEQEEYTIFCEHFNQATPLQLTNDGNYSAIQANIKDFCTLEYKDGEKIKTLVGLSFKDTTVSVFLNNLKGELSMFVEGVSLTSEDGFENICNDINAGETSNENFFTQCPSTELRGAQAGIAYNPDFEILLFAQSLDNPATDFEGVFGDDAHLLDYIESYWNKLIGLFAGWFGFGDASGNNIQWTNETILPLFSNATSTYTENLEGGLNDDAPIAGKVVDFQRLLLRKNQNNLVNGFVETMDVYENEALAEKEIITIEYIGFNTSVRYLADQYFSGEEYELQYAKGNNKQILQLVEPKEYGENNDGEVKTFEPIFTWQRIAPLLYFSGEEQLNPITAEQGDGVVDIGEWCDTDENGNLYFKYRNNDCAFWNETHPYGLLRCEGTELDHQHCQTNYVSEHCYDGIDNDDNGYVDCEDEDCEGLTICDPEQCSDGIDNNLNMLTDCFDPDCENAYNCESEGSVA